MLTHMRMPETKIKKLFYYHLVDRRVMYLWSFYFDVEQDYNLSDEQVRQRQEVIMKEIGYHEEIIVELLNHITYDEIFKIKDEYGL